MKKKFWLILLALASALCLAFGFTACGKNKCAEGHTWEEKVTDATCTEEGYVERTCTVCGETEYDPPIPAKGHTWEEKVTDATCTEEGFVERTCSVCGISDNYTLPPNGHKYDTVNPIRAATCTQKGQEEHVCSVCGDVEIVETTTIPHTYIETSYVAPTCSKDGEIRTMCTMCGDVVYTTVGMLGHLTRTIPAREPTCTQEGYSMEIVCDRCGEVLQPKETLEMKPHAFSEGICTDCGAEQTFTASFVAMGQTVKQIAFTVSTRSKVTDEAPPVPAAQKGYSNARWEPYEVVLQDFTVHALYDATRYPISYHDPKNAPNTNPNEYTVEQTVELSELQFNGYTFEGWYSGEEKVTELPAGTTGAQSFEARWSLTQYTITYEGITDPNEYDLPSTYTIESDPISLPVLQAAGRTFRGWEMDGKTVAAIPRGSYGDITLRALFDPLTFRITLDAAGGTASKSYQNVDYGEYYTLPIPVREGYDFLGWYTNSGDTGVPYTDNAGASLEIYAQFNDKVLYAHWANKIFTVLYDSCGGDPVSPKTYLYGELFVPAETSNENGYLFDGWYNESYSVKYTDATPVTESMTVYARWIDSIPVSTPEGLAAIADAPTKNYHLTQDINLKGMVWTPIEEFSGVLNGNGHSVINFILSSEVSADNYAFIKINRGKIDSLNFLDIVFNLSVTTDVNMRAAVYAATNFGTIANCKIISGKISCNYILHDYSDNIFGAFAGYNESGALVESCCLTADVVCSIVGDRYNNVRYDYIGALVGINAGEIRSSHFIGKFEGFVDTSRGTYLFGERNSGYFGWIAGKNDGGTILNCYSESNMILTATLKNYNYNYSNIYGGLCALQTGKTSSIIGCYSKGSIVVSGTDEIVAGAIAAINTSEAMIANCYSNVEITGKSTGEFGAFVGRNEAIVKNCYATGSVTCESTSAQNYAGGFVGHATPSSNISMCYSTGNVRAEGGSADHFVGLSDNGSTLYKVYYLSRSTVTINGVRLEKVTEYGSSKNLGELWSEDFLVSELYWDEEGWIILFDEDPILDWETSVSHNYASYIVEPTCVDFGYTVYVCRDCNRIFVRAYTQPLGHRFDYDHPETVEHTCTADGHIYYKCLNEGEESLLYDSGEVDPATGHTQGEYIRGEKATCTEDGFAVYRCKTCDEEYTVYETATGHTLPEGGDDGNGFEGSCSAGQVIMGKTASITCEVCGTVIRQQEEISPHKFEEDPSQGKAATCTEDGKQFLRCVRCGAQEERTLPATGHTVPEGTARCAICKQYVIDQSKIVKIGNLQQLKSIAQNPNGIYMLSADIDLSQEDWIPLGSERSPFTGWLFGDSHKIKNLTVRANALGGLFAVNKGHIVGVTIENAYLYAEDLPGASLGAFAAFNAGEIVGCTLTGNVFIKASVSRIVSDLDAHFDDFENSIGGIAGTNDATGKIASCTMSATMSVVVSQFMKNSAKIDQFYFLRRLWQKDWAVSLASFYVGGIAGTNLGKIVEQCTVSGSVKVENEQEIDIRHQVSSALLGELPFSYNAGNAKVTMDLYAGSITGYNVGTVLKCSATRITIAQIEGTLSSKGKLFSTLCEMNTQWGTDGYGSLIGCNASSGVSDELVFL